MLCYVTRERPQHGSAADAPWIWAETDTKLLIRHVNEVTRAVHPGRGQPVSAVSSRANWAGIIDCANPRRRGDAPRKTCTAMAGNTNW